jgi:hypothetical protein
MINNVVFAKATLSGFATLEHCFLSLLSLRHSNP